MDSLQVRHAAHIVVLALVLFLFVDLAVISFLTATHQKVDPQFWAFEDRALIALLGLLSFAPKNPNEPATPVTIQNTADEPVPVEQTETASVASPARRRASRG